MGRLGGSEIAAQYLFIHACSGSSTTATSDLSLFMRLARVDFESAKIPDIQSTFNKGRYRRGFCSKCTVLRALKMTTSYVRQRTKPTCYSWCGRNSSYVRENHIHDLGSMPTPRLCRL